MGIRKITSNFMYMVYVSEWAKQVQRRVYSVGSINSKTTFKLPLLSHHHIVLQKKFTNKTDQKIYIKPII